MTKQIIPVPPASVKSPRSHWTLIAVLEADKGGVALAIGSWDNDPALAIRWNGSPLNPIGNPQSRGLPTWFILPTWTYEAVLSKLELTPANHALVQTFLLKAK